MTAPVSLTMTGDQHASLLRHLFPGDGNEAVAVLLCGRCDGDRRHRLIVRTVAEIPHAACPVRTPDQVTWRPDDIAPLLDRASDERLSVVKVHSHPGGFASFSKTDDEGDARLLPMIKGWVESDLPHGSAVMLPDGQMFGRILDSTGCFAPIEVINVVGDDLHFWYHDAGTAILPNFAASHAQVFDTGTIERLHRLWVAVIGCSGVDPF